MKTPVTHIVFDLDYTLLNTRRLKFHLYQSVSNYVSRQKFNKSYKQIMRDYAHGYNYTTEEQAKVMANGDKKLFMILNKNLQNALSDARNDLYKDALDFLNYTKKLPVKKLLITFANPHFQKQKLKALKINNFFDQVIIVTEHKNKVRLPLPIKGKGLVFINDNVKECLDLEKKFPLAIFLTIPRHKKYKVMTNSFKTHRSLSEIKNSLKKIV